MPEDLMTQEQQDKAWNEAVSGIAPDAPALPAASAPAEDKPAPAGEKVEGQEQTSDVADTTAVQKTNEAASAAPAVDPMQQRLDGVTAALATMGQDLKRVIGRVGQMQSEAEQARRAQQAAQAAGQDAPTAAQIAAAEGDLGKWEALKGDFPEWSAGMEQFVDVKLRKLQQTQTAKTGSPVDIDALRQQVREEMAAEFEDSKVTDKYEDWRAVVKTDKFKGWFNTQPDDIKQLAQSPFARHTIKVLDAFYAADKAPLNAQPGEQQQTQAQPSPAAAVQQQRQTKLATAAAATHVNTKAPATTRAESQLTADEIWKQEVARYQKESAI